MTGVPQCTGWLINFAPANNPNDRCMITAGHCRPVVSSAGFEPIPPPVAACTPLAVPAAQRFGIDLATAISANAGCANDWMVFRTLQNPVTMLTAFQTQNDNWIVNAPRVAPAAKFGYGTVGNPDGTEPVAPDPGPCSCDATGGIPDRRLLDNTQTHGVGAITAVNGTSDVRYNVHDCFGDSGAPIYNTATPADGVAIVNADIDGIGPVGCTLVGGVGRPLGCATAASKPAVLRAIANLCPVMTDMDHYLCYGARDLNRPRQDPGPVQLRDQFVDLPEDPKSARMLCTPADKNDSGIVDPATHLKRYPLQSGVRGLPTDEYDIVNQFGTVRLRLREGKAEIAVPTAKDLGSTPSPPALTNPGFDHYRCYDLHRVRFPQIMVTVSDQFGAARSVVVRRPKRLCAPASKDGSLITNEVRHLLCYQVKDLSVTRPPTVFVNNQFGPETLLLQKARELCVPSLKILASSPSGAFLDDASAGVF
jgi:hypothetical protein